MGGWRASECVCVFFSPPAGHLMASAVRLIPDTKTLTLMTKAPSSSTTGWQGIAIRVMQYFLFQLVHLEV